MLSASATTALTSLLRFIRVAGAPSLAARGARLALAEAREDDPAPSVDAARGERSRSGPGLVPRALRTSPASFN